MLHGSSSRKFFFSFAWVDQCFASLTLHFVESLGCSTSGAESNNLVVASKVSFAVVEKELVVMSCDGSCLSVSKLQSLDQIWWTLLCPVSPC